MEEERVYPLIKTEEVNEIVKNKIYKDLNIERLNHMIKEEKILEDLLIRYNRVKKSWGKADSIVKVIGVMIIVFRRCIFNNLNMSWRNRINRCK